MMIVMIIWTVEDLGDRLEISQQKNCKSVSPVGLDGPDKHQLYQLVGEIRWWCSGDNLGDNLDDELGDDGDDPEVECIK